MMSIYKVAGLRHKEIFKVAVFTKGEELVYNICYLGVEAHLL